MGSGLQRVSVHGGHSGEFCNHAADTLADIIQAYIRCGYTWVGITEHIPPVSDNFLYPDEVEAGLNAEKMHIRFENYMREARQLQLQYRRQIELFVGMETETYSGYQKHVEKLIETFRPDYLVGSIHHVDDIPIDCSPGLYDQAVEQAGGINALYCRFFDQQYAMLESIKPAVVGHFDLIRIYDPDYQNRLKLPEIKTRVRRNLEIVKKYDSILDYNIRALQKGGAEPYVAASILALAQEMNISVIPGDDSHGVNSIGVDIDTAIATLANLGFDTSWKKPRLLL